MKAPKLRAAHFVVAWVLVLSLLPLAYDLATPHMWVGYGEGSYTFDNSRLRVELAGITYGGNKPLVEAYLKDATTGGPVGGNPQELVEVSDQASYVDGAELFNASSSTRVVNDSAVLSVYTGPNFTVTKQVRVTGSGVVVSYSSPRPMNYDISFWHWYYDSVNGTTSHNIGGAGCTSLSSASVVEASFSGVSAAQLHTDGSLEVAASGPASVRICGDSTGINKFVVLAQSQAISFKISGSVATAGGVSPVSQAIYDLGSALPFQVAFPMAAVMVILIWRRQSRSR